MCSLAPSFFEDKEDAKDKADHSHVHTLVEEESLALKFVWSEVGHLATTKLNHQLGTP